MEISGNSGNKSINLSVLNVTNVVKRKQKDFMLKA
jgi:hypothetical protein